MVDPERHSHQTQGQAQGQPQRGWLANKLHNFHLTHERVKHTVHTAWRLPLPPWGQAAMGFVYFTIPVIAGYHITKWAVSQSDSTLEERLGKAGPDHVAKNIQGLGDKTVVRGKDGEERVEKVGAGGWGGGVHLVTGDTKTQDVNRINLERFLKKQRKEKRKREREARRKEQEAKEASAA